MEHIEVSAKTVEDAVLEAAIQLGTTRDKVAYEVISQGSSGLFGLGLGGKKAVIKARIKTDEEAAAALKAEKEVEKILEKVNDKASKGAKVPEVKSQPQKKESTVPVKPDKPKKQEKTEPQKKEPEKKEEAARTEHKEIQENVKKFLDQVFAAMEMKVQVTVTENPGEREMSVDLEGEDMGVLIGKRGQTLDSLQYLTSLVANKESEDYIRVKVDTENYRERRKATLENLAKNISHKVKRTRKPVALEPMNPYERRVIHSALQHDKFVCTHSEGEEPYRRVVVTLKEGVRLDNYNGSGRNRNRYNRNYKRKER